MFDAFRSSTFLKTIVPSADGLPCVVEAMDEGNIQAL